MNWKQKEVAEAQQGYGEKVLSGNYPLWWKILNLQTSDFEWSKYLGKWRLKNLGILRKLAPGLYESCYGEVRENQVITDIHGNKVKVGKKVGSIPLVDYMFNPELHNNREEQDKYFKEHPEFKAK